MRNVYETAELETAVFDRIRSFVAEHGYAPTVREICVLENIPGPATVQERIDSLVHKGLLLRDGRRSRTLRIPA